MKKILPVLLFIALFSTVSHAQETQTQNNQERKNFSELKLNMTNLIGFKWFDLGYEYILNEESSIGFGTLFKIGNDPDDEEGIDEYRTFSITPFYRQFFSKKYAQGFFVEGFAMLHSGKNDYYYDYNSGSASGYEKYTDFAIGISAGAKFLTKRGFVAEIYLGIGRDLLGENDIEVVGRGGVALGYRF